MLYLKQIVVGICSLLLAPGSLYQGQVQLPLTPSSISQGPAATVLSPANAVEFKDEPAGKSLEDAEIHITDLAQEDDFHSLHSNAIKFKNETPSDDIGLASALVESLDVDLVLVELQSQHLEEVVSSISVDSSALSRSRDLSDSSDESGGSLECTCLSSSVRWIPTDRGTFNTAAFHSIYLELRSNIIHNYRISQRYQRRRYKRKLEKLIHVLYYERDWWRYVPSLRLMWYLTCEGTSVLLKDWLSLLLQHLNRLLDPMDPQGRIRAYLSPFVGGVYELLSKLLGLLNFGTIICGFAMPYWGVIHPRFSSNIWYAMALTWSAINLTDLTSDDKDKRKDESYLLWFWVVYQELWSSFTKVAVLLWLRGFSVEVEDDSCGVLTIAALFLIGVQTMTKCFPRSFVRGAYAFLGLLNTGSIICGLALPLLGVIHQRFSCDILYLMAMMWNAIDIQRTLTLVGKRKDESFAIYLLWFWNNAHQALCSFYSKAAILLWLRGFFVEDNNYGVLTFAVLFLIGVHTTLKRCYPSILRHCWIKTRIFVSMLLVFLFRLWTFFAATAQLAVSLFNCIVNCNESTANDSSPSDSESSNGYNDDSKPNWVRYHSDEAKSWRKKSSRRWRGGGSSVWLRLMMLLMIAFVCLQGAAAAATTITPLVGAVTTGAAVAAAVSIDGRPTKRPRHGHDTDTIAFDSDTANDGSGAPNADFLPPGFENPDFLPPGFEKACTEAESSFKSRFDNAILCFLDTLRAADQNLEAARELLLDFDEDDPSLNDVRKSIRNGLRILGRQYKSQAEFRKAVEKWKKEFNGAIMKMSGGKYKGRLNLGDGLSPLTVCLMIAHFAPLSCQSYKDTRKYSSPFCKIDRENPCMRMFDWILPKSLHKEAGGEWSEETRQAISERVSIVDAKVLVTKDTDDHAKEFLAFCEDNHISMDEMNLIGFLLFAFHVKHHEIGPRSNTPLNVMVSSAKANRELFAECGYFATKSIRFLSYVAHGQVWASKTLKNYSLYPIERLTEFSARLVCFYRAIAIDIANSPSCHAAFLVPFVSSIAERYAGVVGLTPEELEDLYQNMKALHDLRSDAGELARYFRSNGLAETAEEVYDLLLIHCEDARCAEMWWGCHLGGVNGGAVTGKMMSEAVARRKELIKSGAVKASDDNACLEMIKSLLSAEHANLLRPVLMRSATKDLLDKYAAMGHVDRNNSDECYEYIKEKLSKEHAELWLGSRKGGLTTGEMRRAAVEHRKGLIILGAIEEDDHVGCLALVAEHLSPAHANLLRPVLMRTAANKLRKELISSGQVDASDDIACLEMIKSRLSQEHANLLRPILMKGAAKDLLNKDAESGLVDRDNRRQCYEYIKTHLSEEHADLWLGSRKGGLKGGITTGDMITAAVEYRKELISSGKIEADDHAICLDLVAKRFSEAHANLLRPILMKEVAYEKFRELISMGMVKKDDIQQARKLVAFHLSPAHAKLIGCCGTLTTWEQWIAKLQAYKEEHGNVDVPFRYSGLGVWVMDVRKSYKNKKLDRAKIGQLEGMGFKWSVPRGGGRKPGTRNRKPQQNPPPAPIVPIPPLLIPPPVIEPIPPPKLASSMSKKEFRIRTVREVLEEDAKKKAKKTRGKNSGS